MYRLARLEALLPPKVLSVWRLMTIFLIVISFMVPMFYESPESDGYFSGSVNLAIIIPFEMVELLISPMLVYGLFHYAQEPMFQLFGHLLCLLFDVIGPLTFFAYAILNIFIFFRQWQKRVWIRFGLLGFSLIWLGAARLYSQSGSLLCGQGCSLLWGFNVIVCTVLVGLLLESMSYIVHRRRAN